MRGWDRNRRSLFNLSTEIRFVSLSIKANENNGFVKNPLYSVAAERSFISPDFFLLSFLSLFSFLVFFPFYLFFCFFFWLFSLLPKRARRNSHEYLNFSNAKSLTNSWARLEVCNERASAHIYGQTRYERKPQRAARMLVCDGGGTNSSYGSFLI